MSALTRCLRPLAALLALGGAFALVTHVGLPARGDYAGLAGGRLPSPAVHSKAPSFTLPSVPGGQLPLKRARGTITIINFWATWCRPCRREMGELEDLYADYAGRLRVLAVNQGEPFPVARAWVEALGLTYDVLLDGRGDVSRLYQIRGLPTTYLLDADHVIQRVYYGAVSQARLRQDIDRLERRR